MPNVYFEIKTYGEEPFAGVRVRAVGEELRNELKTISRYAAHIGAEQARRSAPKSHFHRGGPRLSEAIVEQPEAQFMPGALGGGGFYETRFFASSNIAPHLVYVWHGSGLFGSGKRIRPRHKRALSFDVDRGNIARMSSAGSPRQRRWWESAEVAATEALRTGIQTLHLPGS